MHWVQGLRQCILSIVTAYLVCGIIHAGYYDCFAMSIGYQVFLVLCVVYCILGVRSIACILGIGSLGIRAYALDATSRMTTQFSLQITYKSHEISNSNCIMNNPKFLSMLTTVNYIQLYHTPTCQLSTVNFNGPFSHNWMGHSAVIGCSYGSYIKQAWIQKNCTKRVNRNSYIN